MHADARESPWNVFCDDTVLCEEILFCDVNVFCDVNALCDKTVERAKRAAYTWHQWEETVLYLQGLQTHTGCPPTPACASSRPRASAGVPPASPPPPRSVPARGGRTLPNSIRHGTDVKNVVHFHTRTCAAHGTQMPFNPNVDSHRGTHSVVDLPGLTLPRKYSELPVGALPSAE